MKMEEGLTWEDSFQALIFSKGEDSSALQKCWLSLSTSAPHPTERKLPSEKAEIRVKASNHIKANLICQRSSILPKDQDGRISPCFILSSSIGFVACNDRVTVFTVLIQELQENQKHVRVTCCNPSQCSKSVLLPSQKLFEDLSHLHPNLPLWKKQRMPYTKAHRNRLRVPYFMTQETQRNRPPLVLPK